MPTEPLNKCAKPFALINKVNVPTIIRPVAAFSSGTLNNLIAKYTSTSGAIKPTRPNVPYTNAYTARLTTLSACNHAPAPEMIAKINSAKAAPSR